MDDFVGNIANYDIENSRGEERKEWKREAREGGFKMFWNKKKKEKKKDDQKRN